jgi:hypothetical protein
MIENFSDTLMGDVVWAMGMGLNRQDLEKHIQITEDIEKAIKVSEEELKARTTSMVAVRMFAVLGIAGSCFKFWRALVSPTLSAGLCELAKSIVIYVISHDAFVMARNKTSLLTARSEALHVMTDIILMAEMQREGSNRKTPPCDLRFARLIHGTLLRPVWEKIAGLVFNKRVIDFK